MQQPVSSIQLLKSIPYDDKLAVLKEPITYHVKKHENKIILDSENNIYGLSVIASDLNEFLIALETQLKIVWNSYVNEPDEVLTESAKKLKHILLNNITFEAWK